MHPHIIRLGLDCPNREDAQSGSNERRTVESPMSETFAVIGEHIGESDSKASRHCEEKKMKLCDALKLEAQFSFVKLGVELIAVPCI